MFDICVKSSALHGAENGFLVSVIEDVCKPLNESEAGLLQNQTPSHMSLRSKMSKSK